MIENLEYLALAKMIKNYNLRYSTGYQEKNDPLTYYSMLGCPFFFHTLNFCCLDARIPLIFLWEIHFYFHVISYFQGCDAAYLTNINKEFENHPNYFKGEDRRKWDKEFGIRHYAGTVIYRYVKLLVQNFTTRWQSHKRFLILYFLHRSCVIFKGHLQG